MVGGAAAAAASPGSSPSARMAGLRSAGMQQAGRGLRPADVKALDVVATDVAQKGELRGVFHAFADYFQVQAVRHDDDGLDQFGIFAAFTGRGNEGTINFQYIEMATRQPAYGGIAGAEIIQRQAHALQFEFLQYPEIGRAHV